MLARAMSNPLFKTFLAILGGEVAVPLRSFLLQIRAKLRRPRRSRPIDSAESFFTMLKVCRERARRACSRANAHSSRAFKARQKRNKFALHATVVTVPERPMTEVNAP